MLPGAQNLIIVWLRFIRLGIIDHRIAWFWIDRLGFIRLRINGLGVIRIFGLRVFLIELI